MWVVLGLIDGFGLFPEFPQVGLLIWGTTLIISAVAVVVLLGSLILNILLYGAFQIASSGLLSVVVYGALSSAAAILLLALFGVDIMAILTTSAILGAIIALSMKSTLGSIIAGVSLSNCICRPMYHRSGLPIF